MRSCCIAFVPALCCSHRVVSRLSSDGRRGIVSYSRRSEFPPLLLLDQLQLDLNQTQSPQSRLVSDCAKVGRSLSDEAGGSIEVLQGPRRITHAGNDIRGELGLLSLYR